MVRPAAEFYKQLLRGDMGKSIIYRPNVPIMDILKTKAPYSSNLD